ncbi:MAG: 30S ribosomal protein S3 [Patescibacteria group bacterium]|nr:30S ribosomal protein S3 [Patescibacteria group bacterium]MBU2509475.1 30S ribosomal protein S3 [Patescibacteria group bacterium]
MGHKVHPNSYRLNTTTTWPSRWFARDKVYRDMLKQDIILREYLKEELKEAQVSRVSIERSRGSLSVTIATGKPGLVIGRSGAGIEELKKKVLKEFFPGKKVQFQLNVIEVSKASLESTIIARQVVVDIERRMPFRRVLKSTLERVKKAGALGAKIMISGRLGGSEIARTEFVHWGKIPLTNLRADIDYAIDTARTTAGAVGVKVWIYRGDVFEQDRLAQYQPTTPSRNRNNRHPRD